MPRSHAASGALMAAALLSMAAGPTRALRAHSAPAFAARVQDDGPQRVRPSTPDDPALKRITLAVRDLPAREAIELLVERSGISLVYASRAMSANGVVSCRSDNAPAEAMLKCIVRGASLDYYRLSSGTFVVIARVEDAPQYGALAGLVQDALSGAPIPQARVSLAEIADVRTASGNGGFIFTRLRPGRYRLMASAIGYQARVIELVVSDSAALRTTIQLARHPSIVAPVVVNGIAPGQASRTLNRASQALDGIPVAVTGPSLLQAAAPATMGVSPNSGTGDLHIQGGGSGEHQVRLDGIPIFDPIAIDRIYGAFSPLAIGRMTVQRAGFPAAAGSFTAGVIDLEHVLDEGVSPIGARTPGESVKITVQADPGSASARLGTRSSPGDHALSTMLAVRSSLWPILRPSVVTNALRSWNMMSPVLTQRLASAGLIGHEAAAGQGSLPIARAGSELGFTDLHLAARLSLGAFSSLSASGYLGRNRILGDVTLAPVDRAGIDSAQAVEASEAYRWTTAGAQLRFDALVGARAQTSWQLRRSEHALRYGFMIAPMIAPMTATTPGSATIRTMPLDRNSLAETALEGTVSTAAGDALTMQWTGALVHTSSTLQMASGVLRDLRTDLAVSRAVGGADATWRIRRGAWMEAGLRTTWLLSAGRRETEPRLALRGEGITANLGRVAWRVGGGTYRQYVTQFDVATTAPNALLPSMRFWLPVDGSTPTPRAHHLAGEFVAQPGVGWEVRTEVYRKWMPVIAALDYGVLLDHSSRLPHQLSPSRFIGTSRGDAWGAGVRIVREIVREGATLPARDAPPPAPVLRAEIGYDYGMSRRTFPSRFGGSLQPTPWNEPHRVTAALDWRPEPLTVVTLRARGAQGRTWALRQAYYDLLAVGDAGAGLPVQAPGASRRPALMTADVGVSRQWRVGGARVDLGAAVLNALDRRNILDYGLQGPNAATTESGYAFVPRYLLGRQWSLTMRVGP